MRQLATTLAGVLLATLALGGCASRLQGGVHYADHADLNGIERFAFAPANPTLAQAPENVREAHAVTREAIRAYLVGRGFQVVTDGSEHAAVRFQLGVYAKTALAGNQLEGSKGSLQIMLLEPQHQHAVWSGWAELTWREGMDRDAGIQSAVAFILDKFPPRG